MSVNDKIKVVLADRDRTYQDNLKKHLEQEGNISVIGMTDTGAETLALIQRSGADVLLMDVLLGDCDGLWVLEEMAKARIKVDVCIMISAVDCDQVVRKVMKLGADYFMAKPVQSSILLERMEQLYYGKQDMENRQESLEITMSKASHLEHSAILNRHTSFDSLECEISNVLSRMGVSASIKGYHYIRKAIMMAVKNEESLIGITKGLYPDIAKYYNTTSSKVERAIRHAVESSWKRNGEDVFVECSGYQPEGKPTNGQFIAAISEYFRLVQNGKFRCSVS